MARELHIDVTLPAQGPALRRAAVLTDGVLSDLYIDRVERPTLAGAVIRGRVTRIVAGMNAAFVDIGTGRDGLLPAPDVRVPQGGGPQGGGKGAPKDRPAARPQGPIGTALRAGQTIIVQVKADPVGAKGALLSMDVALPGRFLVHTPLAAGIHVSKRLGQGASAAAERARLTTVVRDAVPVSGQGWAGGWIVRAAAAGVPADWLAQEAEALAMDWRGAARAGDGPPATLLAAPHAGIRALMEQTGQPVSAILVDDRAAAGQDLYAELRRWCDDRAADLLPTLKRVPTGLPLFDGGDLDGAIATLLRPRVPLRGAAAGSLVIERTEALTVIDVNGGEKGDPLAVNLAAVPEIARQLRLRNVGGIVVVDFINLSRPPDRERLILALTGAVADDPGNTQVYGMSRLGLVEMTRQRRGPSLLDLVAADAPAPGVLSDDDDAVM
ncbi:ribonuclease E/ribonuclease G [Nitrospirillum amazonense]|uniref:Ribonuclease E/ribonuclease G n=1 Tax=Nitrospirillum amazonense TaxID=28077 RepID=A0A560K3F6_9PROT|nr:ribonuclease E/G [Nitrospirillum amazonense]TWB77539.1 ribonuclease E/ribonuclease G [Nitrospirillum amazonense]